MRTRKPNGTVIYNWEGAVVKSNSGSIGDEIAPWFLSETSLVVEFRARSRGPRGASPWVTVSHTYTLNTSATVAPSGLTVTRKGNNLTFAWKIADSNYGKGQQLQYRYSNAKKDTWENITVGATTVSKVVTIPVANYYPNTTTKLDSVSFRCRGIRSNYMVHDTKSSKTAKRTEVYNPQWSAWSSKTFDFALSNVPTASTEWDDEHNNVTTFSWETATTTEGAKHFSNVELQTIRVKECTETDGSKLSWKSTTDG